VAVEFILRVEDWQGPERFRWVLAEPEGAFLAEHRVTLSPADFEPGGYLDLAARWYGPHWQRALTQREGARIGEIVLGEISEAILGAMQARGGSAAVVHVRLPPELPPEVADLLRGALEIARARGGPLERQRVRFVYELSPGSAHAAPPPPEPPRSEPSIPVNFSVDPDEGNLDDLLEYHPTRSGRALEAFPLTASPVPGFGPPPGGVDAPPPVQNWRSPELAPDEPPTLHLNAWFPDQPGDDIVLTLDVPASLCVQLGPQRGAGASEALSGAVVHALYEVEAIDVLVLCPGADIAPISRRLRMPPDPARVLAFTITPRRAGRLALEVVLLVHNEPIHRMPFPVEARAAEGAQVAGSPGQA